MMKHDISAALIVNNDPHLTQTVQSIRPYVSQVVIFCDSDDDVVAERARALCDRFERAYDLNGPNGRLADWSAARNRAHAMANGRWVFSIDSDDILVNGEKLDEVCDEYASSKEPVRISMPYLYCFDLMTQRCTRLQPRVRLVLGAPAFEWRGKAHEGWYTKPGFTCRDAYDLRVSVRHTKRDWTAAMARASEIIGSYPDEKGELTDPRERFDVGMQAAAEGDAERAVRELTRYVAESGRNDEKAQACIRLAELTGSMSDRLAAAMHWAWQAHQFAPDAFEPLYKLAQLRTLQAMTGGGKEAALEAIEYAKQAVATPLDSLVPYSPQDRDVGVYELRYQAARVASDEYGPIHALGDGLVASHYEPGLMLLARDIGKFDFGPGCRDVVFLLGNTSDPWNPVSVEASGAGGSELATIAMAKGLAAKGHRVRVYIDCGREGLYDGVEYLHPWHLNEDQDEVDLLVAWRNAYFLEAIPARIKYLWVHDTHIHRASPYWISLADRVLALSDWHRDFMLKHHGKALRQERVFRTRNGVDVSRFGALGATRDPHKAVYASSWDRGLENMLAVWPRIRRRVPDATLEVFYGAATLQQTHAHRAAQIRADVEDLRACGVTVHGRVGQAELARQMLGAGVLAYPTAFRETFACVAAEAQCAGLRIVTSACAALNETVHDGVLLGGDPTTEEYRELFVDSVVHAMTAPEDGDRERISATACERFAWGPVVDDWNRMLEEDLAEADGEAAAE